MKKSILLSTALVVGISAFAQTQRQLPQMNTGYKLNRVASPEEATLPPTHLNPKADNHNSVLTGPPYVKFSSAMNAIGFTGDQHTMSWNQDLNCLALFQRHTADWPNSAFFPAPGSGKSGYQVVKFTTNNGASWDSVNYYQDETYWGRYPAGVIYNPMGNTTLGNGWFVGTGPCTGSGSNWFANWFASVQIPTGATNRTQTTNDQQNFSTSAPGSVADKTYFSAYSTCIGGPAASPTVYTGGTKLTGAPVSTSLSGVYGVAIFKGVFNGTNGFTWSQDSSFTNKWTVSGGDADVSTPHIAFGPDGMTGYILTNGSDSTATLPNAKKFYQPMVWKTTDGGANWTRVNQNYDWVANHPEILGNLKSTRDASGTYPDFLDAWGGDIAVDANGTLHYATAVQPAYSTHRDSLGYIFSYSFGYQQYACDDRPWVFDFMTNGNGTWTTTKITDLFTSKMSNATTNDTNATYNLWTNSGSYLGYDNGLRISRSADGTKIFYTWSDSDTSNNLLQYYDGSTFLYNAYPTNSYPSLYFRGMDVNSGMLSAIHENNSGNSLNGGYWFYSTPTTAVTTGSDYEIPMIYIDSRAGAYDGTAAVDVYYIDDNTILGTEFTQPGYAPCIVGIKEVAGTTVSNVSQNFPNPFNGTSTVKVNLNKAENITLNVTNSIGQLVSTQTVKGNAGENQLSIDASSLNSGIYFYTVISGDSKVTRKMSVTK